MGKDDILKGPQDLQLNLTGIEQSKRAGVKLKNGLGKFSYANAKIVTSPLKRAMGTAKNISQITGIAIPEQEDGFRERYYGDYRLLKDKDGIPSDAETTEEFQKRVTDTLHKVLKKNSSFKSLIIVSHQKVFEWVSESLAQRKERLNQGGIGHFIRQDDGTCKLEILETSSVTKP